MIGYTCTSLFPVIIRAEVVLIIILVNLWRIEGEGIWKVKILCMEAIIFIEVEKKI